MADIAIFSKCNRTLIYVLLAVMEEKTNLDKKCISDTLTYPITFWRTRKWQVLRNLKKVSTEFIYL